MTRIPEGMFDSAQEALSRAKQIGAITEVGHDQIRIMPDEALDEMVNHQLAVSLVPYLVQMASRGEAVSKQEHREPGSLSSTFRADVVAISVDDFSHLCGLIRRMKQLNAEMDRPA